MSRLPLTRPNAWIVAAAGTMLAALTEQLAADSAEDRREPIALTHGLLLVHPTHPSAPAGRREVTVRLLPIKELVALAGPHDGWLGSLTRALRRSPPTDLDTRILALGPQGAAVHTLDVGGLVGAMAAGTMPPGAAWAQAAAEGR